MIHFSQSTLFAIRYTLADLLKKHVSDSTTRAHAGELLNEFEWCINHFNSEAFQHERNDLLNAMDIQRLEITNLKTEIQAARGTVDRLITERNELQKQVREMQLKHEPEMFVQISVCAESQVVDMGEGRSESQVSITRFENVTKSALDEMELELKQDNRIKAIKVLRGQTGMGLKEAKLTVEQIEPFRKWYEEGKAKTVAAQTKLPEPDGLQTHWPVGTR